MPPNSSNPAAPSQEPAKSSTGRRLIAAAVLIGLAMGGLALIDRFLERPAAELTPPHEPSEALITPPAAEPNFPTASPDQPITPPPPPNIINNETLAPPPRAISAKPWPQAAPDALPEKKTASTAGKAYLVQVGVFTSPANAQALQKQLQRAGLEAHLETRVQIGPFRDRREADKALVRAKKLGINAVLVGSR